VRHECGGVFVHGAVGAVAPRGGFAPEAAEEAGAPGGRRVVAACRIHSCVRDVEVATEVEFQARSRGTNDGDEYLDRCAEPKIIIIP